MLNLEQLKKTIVLSHRIALAAVISIFVLYGFYLLSEILNDFSWFARSGSILVCIGVLTAAYDIKGKMEESNSPKAHRNQAIILEAAIVIVGTLVWGFGDLLILFHE